MHQYGTTDARALLSKAESVIRNGIGKDKNLQIRVGYQERSISSPLQNVFYIQGAKLGGGMHGDARDVQDALHTLLAGRPGHTIRALRELVTTELARTLQEATLGVRHHEWLPLPPSGPVATAVDMVIRLLNGLMSTVSSRTIPSLEEIHGREELRRIRAIQSLQIRYGILQLLATVLQSQVPDPPHDLNDGLL